MGGYRGRTCLYVAKDEKRCSVDGGQVVDVGI